MIKLIKGVRTFINLNSQCFEPWLWIPLTRVNYLLLNSALVFVRTQKYFALCSICALLHLRSAPFCDLFFWKIVLRGAKVPNLVKEQLKLTILTIYDI